MLHDKATIDTLQSGGGSGKMSVSSARAKAREVIAPQLKQLRKQYVNPDADTFNIMPPASQYRGKKIQDETTGQVFLSDGNEWVLQGNQ